MDVVDRVDTVDGETIGVGPAASPVMANALAGAERIGQV